MYVLCIYSFEHYSMNLRIFLSLQKNIGFITESLRKINRFCIRIKFVDLCKYLQVNYKDLLNR